MKLPCPRIHSSDALFVAFLAVAGTVLGATTLPGTFSIDDANHIAAVVGLKAGHFGLPGTEHLPPSQELLSFDPAPRSRTHVPTPVVSSIPPLYGFFALPFSLWGVTGLQWLNVLGTLWATWLVYALTVRHAANRRTGWYAAALFLLGGYVLEYAQGIWSHGLSVALCMSCFYAASTARTRRGYLPAALAGLAGGLAAGVRYQNVVFALLVGAGLLMLSRRRWRLTLTYAAALGSVLLISSALNHARYGSWNPVSKGPGYLTVGSERGWSAVPEAAHATWARLVDASSHPPFTAALHEMNAVLPKDPDTGAFYILGVVRKAMLQSSPWLALALVSLVAVWVPQKEPADGQSQETRAVSLVFFGMLLAFSVFGFGRAEGWAFNQRYMLDVIPLAAIATAWHLERLPSRTSILAGGLVAGLGVAASTLWLPTGAASSRTLLILTVPVVLAGLTILIWLLARLHRILPRASACARLLVPGAVAAGLGWAAVVHVGEDVLASRKQRYWHADMAAAIGEAIPPTPSALFVHWGGRDPVAPLLLSKDIVIIDTWPDDGRDSPLLVDALLGEGRAVFVVPTAPTPILLRVLNNRAVEEIWLRNGQPLFRIASPTSIQ